MKVTDSDQISLAMTDGMKAKCFDSYTVVIISSTYKTGVGYSDVYTYPQREVCG